MNTIFTQTLTRAIDKWFYWYINNQLIQATESTEQCLLTNENYRILK